MFDVIPASLEAKFPLLLTRTKDIDDLLLQEVYVTMFKSCELPTTPFPLWRELPQQLMLFQLSSKTGPELVGGMLFAAGTFLFSDTPFVRTRVKDVRCRLEFDVADGVAWLSTVPQPPAASSMAAPSSPPSVAQKTDKEAETLVSPLVPLETSPSAFFAQFDAIRNEDAGASHGSKSFEASAQPTPSAPALTAASAPKATSSTKAPQYHVSANGIVTSRVFFRLEEFECTALPWVVQRFQLTEPATDVPYGPVFTRAFQPYSSTGQMVHPLPPGTPGRHHSTQGEGSPSLSSAPSASPLSGFGVGVASSDVRKAKRKAVAGEERLRVLKPHLYQWCLDRSPADLGTAIVVVKEILLYYKHTFSVVRTVRTLMRSVRILQMSCRRMLNRKKLAIERMMSEWCALEAQVVARLEAYEPLPGDEIDAAVNSVLKAYVVTPEKEKLELMSEIYRTRQDERRSLSREMRIALSSRYRFYISGVDLLAEAHRRLLDRLCYTADEESPLFQDARILKHMLGGRTAAHLRRRLEVASRELRKRKPLTTTMPRSERVLTFPGIPRPAKVSGGGLGKSPREAQGGATPVGPATGRKKLQSPQRKPAKPQHLEALGALFDFDVL